MTPDTPENHAELLQPYADAGLLDELTDDQIAEQLDIDAAAVAAYREKFWHPEPPEVIDDAQPAEAADPTPPETDEASKPIEPGESVLPNEDTVYATREEAEAARKGREQRRAVKEAFRPDPREEAMNAVYRPLSNALESLYRSESPDAAKKAWADLQAAVSGPVPAVFLQVQPTENDGAAAPRCVRATKVATITGPDGRPLRLRFRDVFKGATAAFLWAHHRTLVEVYPRT